MNGSKTQYRPSWFFHSKDQDKAAYGMKESLYIPARFGNKKMVTEVTPPSNF